MTYEGFLGENNSKSNRRNLSFTIRNLKNVLGILPKEKAKNKDCIENIRGFGYRVKIKMPLRSRPRHIKSQ